MLDERLVHHHLKRPPPPKRRGYLRAATTLPTGSVKVAGTRRVHRTVHPASAGPHDGQHHDTALSRTEVVRGRLGSCGRCGRVQSNDAVDTRSLITGDSGRLGMYQPGKVASAKFAWAQGGIGTRWHPASASTVGRSASFTGQTPLPERPSPSHTSTLNNPKPSRVPVRPTVHEPGDPGRGPGVTPGCGLTNRRGLTNCCRAKRGAGQPGRKSPPLFRPQAAKCPDAEESFPIFSGFSIGWRLASSEGEKDS